MSLARCWVVEGRRESGGIIWVWDGEKLQEALSTCNSVILVQTYFNLLSTGVAMLLPMTEVDEIFFFGSSEPLGGLVFT